MKRGSIDEFLLSPEGFKRVMDAAGPTLSPQRLEGDLRMCIVGVTTTLAPGQKSTISMESLGQDFQLDHVVVPNAVALDELGNPRLFFHHEQLVMMEGKMTASFILNQDSKDVQRRDLYRKHVFQAGEVFELGVFENVSNHPLVVRAAVVGFCKVNNKPLPTKEERRAMMEKIRESPEYKESQKVLAMSEEDFERWQKTEGESK